MKIQAITYNEQNTFKSKNAKNILNSDEYKYFMKQLDNWTAKQLAIIEKKYKHHLEIEAAIDEVFFIREEALNKKIKELTPPKQSFFKNLLQKVGLI